MSIIYDRKTKGAYGSRGHIMKTYVIKNSSLLNFISKTLRSLVIPENLSDTIRSCLAWTRYPIRRFHLPEVILRCLRAIIIKKNNNTKSWTDDGWLKNPFPRREFLAYVFPALHQACKVGATMIPISQMRKLRYREVKSLIRKISVSMWCLPASTPCVLTTGTLPCFPPYMPQTCPGGLHLVL